VRARFPFTAIVGQDAMKTALLVAAVDPGVGGVLIQGHRGTAKSTAVRALAGVLPPLVADARCRYGCDPAGNGSRCDECHARERAGTAARPRRQAVPVVDLPLGATEDRVVGALDLERALRHGEKAYEPGLLARAHRGFLYVDEVNLLEDHLVDLLLDVSTTGENVVEREGLSVRHPARFVLVGSGNPEEGDPRPQLLDRFGLSVEVVTSADPDARVEAVLRRDAFDRDPHAFARRWARPEAAVRRGVAAARGRIGAVEVPHAVLRRGAELCARLGTDGVRGELTLLRAARAAAALAGAAAVTDAELRQVAPMALRHRLRRDPLDDAGSTARVERAVDALLGPASPAVAAALPA
jgi:magnesium chelatase subunit I